MSIGELVAAMRDVVRQEATPEGWQATVRKHHSSFCESLVHHEFFCGRAHIRKTQDLTSPPAFHVFFHPFVT